MRPDGSDHLLSSPAQPPPPLDGRGGSSVCAWSSCTTLHGLRRNRWCDFLRRHCQVVDTLSPFPLANTRKVERGAADLTPTPVQVRPEIYDTGVGSWSWRVLQTTTAQAGCCATFRTADIAQLLAAGSHNIELFLSVGSCRAWRQFSIGLVAVTRSRSIAGELAAWAGSAPSREICPLVQHRERAAAHLDPRPWMQPQIEFREERRRKLRERMLQRRRVADIQTSQESVPWSYTPGGAQSKPLERAEAWAVNTLSTAPGPERPTAGRCATLVSLLEGAMKLGIGFYDSNRSWVVWLHSLLADPLIEDRQGLEDRQLAAAVRRRQRQLAVEQADVSIAAAEAIYAAERGGVVLNRWAAAGTDGFNVTPSGRGKPAQAHAAAGGSRANTVGAMSSRAGLRVSERSGPVPHPSQRHPAWTT